ncbi:MAG: hypothetical protein NVV82_24160 [Sporocytophaga sp.]|nr:hypothetical protein [Sporocytophaga sp.]
MEIIVYTDFGNYSNRQEHSSDEHEKHAEQKFCQVMLLYIQVKKQRSDCKSSSESNSDQEIDQPDEAEYSERFVDVGDKEL